MSDTKHNMVLDPGAPIAAQRVHPLVQRVLEGTPDAATLREVMALQREWEAGEARKAFTRAMTALKRDLPAVIARDATVDYKAGGSRVHYRHASLAGAMEAVTDPLTQHGFAVSWHPSRTERGDVVVSCTLTHSEGHSESCSVPAPPDTSGGKSPAQSVASTITLLSRYTLLSLLGIATADMREPTGEADGSRVDPARNLRAVEAITRRGRRREDAEAVVGRSVSEWTVDDLGTVKTWLRSERASPAADPDDYHEEPPDDVVLPEMEEP